MKKLLAAGRWVWDHIAWIAAGILAFVLYLLTDMSREERRKAYQARDKTLEEESGAELDQATKAHQGAKEAKDEAEHEIEKERVDPEKDADEALQKWKDRHDG